MLGARLYLAQRISALIMAPLVIGHLVMMIYAIQGGLDASEILGRTRGSVSWAMFYSVFVAAVSVHAAIGLRVVAGEHLKIEGRTLDWMAWGIGLILFGLGCRAVAAVVLA